MSVKGVDLVWPGGEHHFCLPIDNLRALEQKCDAGPAWILQRLTSQQWRVDDVLETIRLALVGGGMDANDARRLVVKVTGSRPITEFVLTAQAALMAALYGGEDEEEDDSAGEPTAAADT